ncbi:antitoxin [Pseudonocardia asaccharolytica]|uniref:Antitoxin n=1 Tax=Pseudonocardia asaccharolytica DSM 44247 = NBRC 16224 TaxID=1123024 RepID=A0A511D4V4_9PSEU|nr:antitoxin [Pseudonocardia asaccharolytica]GEL19829.1 hypothetical protein PA7_36660 [Pseudonocardia asaccharolytica DSM 44247 = NBRC 16224]
MSLALRARTRCLIVDGMGFLDKAKQLLGQHDDKVDQGLDKAGEAAKRRYAGHDEQIDSIVEKARGATGQGDTTAAPPPAAPPPEAAPGEEPPPENRPR